MASPVLDVHDQNAHGRAAFEPDGGRSVEVSFKDFSGLLADLSGGNPCLIADAVGVPDHLVGDVVAVAVDGTLGTAVAFGRTQSFQKRRGDQTALSAEEMSVHGTGYRGFRGGGINGIGFHLDGFAGGQNDPIEGQHKAFIMALERACEAGISVCA